MTHARFHMDFISNSISEIEQELFRRSRPYDRQAKHLATIPSITELSVLFILSEINADMSVFESAEPLISRVRLTPANNESANKKTFHKMFQSRKYLKPLLGQCALAAVKSKKQPFHAIKYKRIAKRRGRKKADIAIARMIHVSINHILTSSTDFCPNDYEQVINPSVKAETSYSDPRNNFSVPKRAGC